MANGFDNEDRANTKIDHDLLIKVDAQVREICKDVRELHDDLKIMNMRWATQPRQCQADFVTRGIYDLQITNLTKMMNDGFISFRNEQTEERKKNRWWITIIITVVNIAINLFFHMVARG